jgi:hypothetical protein
VINGPPLQEDSVMMLDEDFGGEEKEEERKEEEKKEGVELQLEDRHPVMLIQDAGEIDGAEVLDEEDDELTNKEVAMCLPEDHRSKNVSGEHSVLGIVWNTLTDVFKYPKYDLTPWSENMSRKTMLQQVASIYDPWGGACPSLTKPNNTDEVQVENPCKRAKITPECIQHKEAVAEVKKKKTIATTKEVRKIVKKSEKGQVPSRVQPKRAVKKAKNNQE